MLSTTIVLALGAYGATEPVFNGPLDPAGRLLKITENSSPQGSRNPIKSGGANAASLGINGSLGGRRMFPDDNPWNTPIDTEPVDPLSDSIISTIGANDPLHPDFGANWNGGPFGIPYIVVSKNQPKVPMDFIWYGDESDPGPYPFPPNAPVENGSDRHVLVIDVDNWILYETFYSFYVGPGWQTACGAKFDLNSNALRPDGWTSADAAGLPILAGLVRYDEVYEQGAINHALRFTVQITRKAYIHPATHYASSNTSTNRPPMGTRFRLKASFDISSYPPHAQVILRALKKYGMFVADNGSDMFLSGTADPRWNDDEMNTLKNVKASDFEVVKMGPIHQ